MVAVKKPLDGSGKEKERQVAKNEKEGRRSREKKGGGHKGQVVDRDVVWQQSQRASKKLLSWIGFDLNICPIPAK